MLNIFKYENREVRTQLINNEPYFCLKDVCDILKLEQPSIVLQRLDRDGVNQIKGVSLTTNQYGKTTEQKTTINFINEPNLYRVIFRSDKKEAKIFQDWVCDDLLPQLRKTGSYSLHIPNKNNPFHYAINFCEPKIGNKIHKSVIEFIEIHNYYKNGKAYNCQPLYDIYEMWCISTNTEKCINYSQFTHSIKNLGFIRGLSPTNRNIFVYREIVSSRKEMKQDQNSVIEYSRVLKQYNRRQEINEYGIKDGWL